MNLRRDDLKAIVVTGAKGRFSGAFDINAFGGLQEGLLVSISRSVQLILVVVHSWYCMEQEAHLKRAAKGK
ncbi:hypothetical protein L1987_21829 [Smallanthus sonchifolius]|uniref:Uncharacterized protein n=1 Tax=Smallanthus sonchifolius TaxID=185202 RepID=A0ACB9IDT6_9ASTR|nr:hypothetical protein L1987_21829 [Smallanthus sonchifolius]